MLSSWWRENGGGGGGRKKIFENTKGREMWNLKIGDGGDANGEP